MLHQIIEDALADYMAALADRERAVDEAEAINPGRGDWDEATQWRISALTLRRNEAHDRLVETWSRLRTRLTGGASPPREDWPQARAATALRTVISQSGEQGGGGGIEQGSLLRLAADILSFEGIKGVDLEVFAPPRLREWAALGYLLVEERGSAGALIRKGPHFAVLWSTPL